MECLFMSSKTRKVMRLADDEKLDEAVYLSSLISVIRQCLGPIGDG